MQARQSVHRLVEFLAPERKPGQDPFIPNACLSKGTERAVEVTDPKAPPETFARKVLMTGADVGSFEGCKRIMELVMAKDACVSKHSFFFRFCVLSTLPS